MCGGSAPQDNSAEVARIDAENARLAREAQDKKDAETRTAFEGRLGNAFSTAQTDARNYFSNEGLDPDEYSSAISSAASSAKSRVPDLDGSPGTYFDNLGATVFDQLQGAEQNKALRGIDSFARSGFATKRIGSEVDDPFLASILEDDAVAADDYIRRLLDRGVITESGFAAAQDDINSQRAGANTRLQDIGLAELERGRGGLRDIASTGRQNASTLRLGDGFDPYSIEGELDTSQADFFANLANNLRAGAPDDLFDTSGLAGIAGAASGAQNTAFDPNALLGAFGEEDNPEDNPEDDEEVFAAF